MAIHFSILLRSGRFGDCAFETLMLPFYFGSGYNRASDRYLHSISAQRVSGMVIRKRSRRFVPAKSPLFAIIAVVLIPLVLWFFWPENIEKLRGDSRDIGLLVFSPNGDYLYSGADNGRLAVWNVAGGSSGTMLDFHPHPINALTISPDGRLLAIACDEDREIRPGSTNYSNRSGAHRLFIFDLERKEIVRAFREPMDAVNDVCFSPDGRTLYALEAKGRLTAWDRETWTLKHEAHVDVLGNNSSNLTISPDGEMLAVGGRTGRQSKTLPLFDAGLARLPSFNWTFAKLDFKINLFGASASKSYM